MGKLKPIGSEKLQGIDKIKRMIEISRYNEHVPNPINEDKSVEYKITLSDENDYQIVKEKNGYVIKKSINESEFDYLEPMKNRKYYSSYSQAMKRLNLITKEVNSLQGVEKNTSLFTEGEEEGKKKYFLKVNTNEQAAPAPSPAPAPAPAPSPSPEASTTPSPEPMPSDDELSLSDTETTDELPSDETETTDDEVVTFKTIQKITGKLGQKIREFTSNEENKMSSNDIKYVINSILSALNLNDLESEDKEEIMNKFEGGEEMSMDDTSMDDISMDTEVSSETPDEMTPEPPPSPEGEMGEETMNPSKMRRLKKRGMRTDEMSKMEEMIEGIFSESKVDNILKKYFIIEEKEKKSENKNIVTKIKNISESISQEVASRKFVKENPDAKLLGKTNSKNLVFESNNKKFVISPKGLIK